MNTLREADQQALEALESLFNWKVDPERGKRCGDAVVALRAALAQQEPEKCRLELWAGGGGGGTQGRAEIVTFPCHSEPNADGEKT